MSRTSVFMCCLIGSLVVTFTSASVSASPLMFGYALGGGSSLFMHWMMNRG